MPLGAWQASEALLDEWITTSRAEDHGITNPASVIAHHAQVLRSMQAFSGASMMHKVRVTARRRVAAPPVPSTER